MNIYENNVKCIVYIKTIFINALIRVYLQSTIHKSQT